MKKKFITAILALSSVGFSVGTVYATTPFYFPLTNVIRTGTTPTGAKFVRLQNATSGPIGGLAVGATADLVFDDDAGLAVILTAMSLGKQVGANVLANGATIAPTGSATSDTLLSVNVAK